MSGDDESLAEFAGTVRLFPLPNMVLFPHVMQPLHIFEPRYREMTRDALADDRLIALVLPQSGWEADYEGKPPLHSVACLARIVADQPLDDGRYNLVVRGIARVAIHAEISNGCLYRSAAAALLHDREFPGAAADMQARHTLQQLLPPWFAEQPKVAEQFGKLLTSDVALGALCDVLSFALPLPLEAKQSLLAETDVAARVQRLLTHLRSKQVKPSILFDASERIFPPPFSEN